MANIAKFYEKLPKGPAPERAPSGPLGWYQAKYFGKNPSAARTYIRDADLAKENNGY
jgi:F-type H+-transporting ATPase subunit f